MCVCTHTDSRALVADVARVHVVVAVPVVHLVLLFAFRPIWASSGGGRKIHWQVSLFCRGHCCTDSRKPHSSETPYPTTQDDLCYLIPVFRPAPALSALPLLVPLASSGSSGRSYRRGLGGFGACHRCPLLFQFSSVSASSFCPFLNSHYIP